MLGSGEAEVVDHKKAMGARGHQETWLTPLPALALRGVAVGLAAMPSMTPRMTISVKAWSKNKATRRGSARTHLSSVSVPYALRSTSQINVPYYVAQNLQ